jgi:hypothetical protein
MGHHTVVPTGQIVLPASGQIVKSAVEAVADLSSLDASNLSSGTVPLARISGLTDAQIAAGAAIAKTKLALAGTLTNADINAAAAIAYSKLALAAAIVNGDIAPAAAIAYSKLNLGASIVDADIAVAAAIAWSKLSKAGSSLADLATRSAADLSSGILASARARTVLANTDTGTKNNWAPGLVGDTFVFWAGVADATITGIAGGTVGQMFGVKNTGTKICYFSHQDAGSAAGNKLVNIVTSGITPIAPGGVAWFMHDGTAWQLIAHQQGGPITVPFAAGNFTSDAGTWTVIAANQIAYSYQLAGRLLTLIVDIERTSVAGGPAQLRVAIPNGYTVSAGFNYIGEVVDNGTTRVSSLASGAGLGYVKFFADIFGAAWANSAANSFIAGTAIFEVP